ncbi:MAG TPA: NAD-glutamate dehydrogenase domain-containing protein [Candidatus Methylomirabilis sp.]|nr:NAD-glutamate dehydrogenase domain-containing protein [Candidatus Methylomirabilis sp.]
MPSSTDQRLDRSILKSIRATRGAAGENLRWLREQMPPFFFISMRDEEEALANLAINLNWLQHNRHLILADQEKELILARLDVPGSIYETLEQIQDREVSYGEMSHSYAVVPGTDLPLEIQRYEFDRKTDAEIAQAGDVSIPARIRREVIAALNAHYPPMDARERERLFRLIWLNNERYVRVSPARRVAQLLWLFHEGRAHGGIFLDVNAEGYEEHQETKVLFAVGNPPHREYLTQVMEVFNRLNLGVRRCYTLTLSTGVHPYFLGSFYVARRGGGTIEPKSELLWKLRRELYNTQILATETPTYRDFVVRRVLTGEEASLIDAFIGFCHTNLVHNQPHRYTLEDVMRAFHSHPDIALRLVRLFEARFDPDLPDRDARYRDELEQTEREVAAYNTGHKRLDEFRRSIFHTTVLFIRRTLKTNFFIPEKHALAFRLDPAYLDDLGPDFTADLPPERPFRVTYFYDRHGLGYHIGFSDIARGGWRTIITQTRDDYVTVANTLFRENYVLAHTQHLKNKDIYEGGSKLVVALRAPDARTKERLNQLLYKIQYDFINAFLDIFITQDGKAKDPRVVDYYGEDEPIELGPDENMHDLMIETIAELSVKRGYVLGIGIMSSKVVGINHKHYGVTSTGVVKFAEVAMRQQGIDIRRDPFSIKFTGGPNGDVAGNAMRLLLERCPCVAIRLIVDGTGAVVDPKGLDGKELSRIVLQQDVEAFDPACLSPGGFLLYRNVRRTEGLRELYKRVARTETGLEEAWVTLDEFHKEFNELLFTVPADLFIPAGGRPETVDRSNWGRFFGPDGTPTARVIVEGANSFITPEARTLLQQKGIVVLRDASANKCGVISSSYEIIGNLLLTPKEFLARKEEYVRDVLAILEQRAANEAELIFRRHREAGGKTTFTQISDAISVEINAQYAKLFEFFQSRPEICSQPLYRRALFAHLPRMIRENPVFRLRIRNLPPKYRSAMLAVEIASVIVYRGGFERNFEEDLKAYLVRMFP